MDVNVHPAKTEVKFADERAAFEAVYVAVKKTLEVAARPAFAAPRAADVKRTSGEATESAPVEKGPQEPLPSLAPDPADDTPRFAAPETPEQARFSSGVLRAAAPAYVPQTRQTSPYGRTPDVGAEDFESVFLPGTVKKPPDSGVPSREAPLDPADSAVSASSDVEVCAGERAAADTDEDFRIVGELFNSYIVVELADEILYIDKHAAHERILYNKLKARETGVTSQMLLEPVVLPLSADDMELIGAHREAFAAAGIEAEDFGGGSLLVREIPQYISADQVAELIADICGRMRAGEPDGIRDDILHSIACKAAVKAGWHTTPGEREALVRDVLHLPDVRYCPHGRPVALVTSRREFEKGFRRV